MFCTDNVSATQLSSSRSSNACVDCGVSMRQYTVKCELPRNPKLDNDNLIKYAPLKNCKRLHLQTSTPTSIDSQDRQLTFPVDSAAW